MPEIVIIGSGITGLTCAHELRKAGEDVLVLEEAVRAGGKISTERVEGYLLEAGPNSLRLENRETRDLVADVGLNDRLLEASPNARKRFILKHGNWIQAPSGPLAAIRTPLLSFRAKLRLLQEIRVPSTTNADESVASFFSRRFGPEILDYAADPFITGIYAGDPAKLSVRHAFPAMWQLEQTAGSIIKGGIRKARQPKSPDRVRSRIVSFPNGLSELTGALSKRLGDRIQFHDGALRLEKKASGFTIYTSAGEIAAGRLILTSPADSVARLISPFAPSSATMLESIDYPPIAVAYLGYENSQFKSPVEGFGGLIPSKEGRKILGIIFSSSNFAGRAPDSHTLLTVLLGGARNVRVSEWDSERIIETAISEVTQLLKPNGRPHFTHSRSWQRAIPQYNVGYQSVLDELARAEQEHPGLHLLGNYRGGISMGSCIRNATELARHIVQGHTI